MNIEKKTKLNPIEVGFRKNKKIPVIPLARQVFETCCANPHSHPRGQLIFAESGIMRVFCEKRSWLVPPTQAVWVPPHYEHQVYFQNKVSLLNIFIDESAVSTLPTSCIVIKVSKLLKELIYKAAKIGDNYELNSPEFRLMMVVIDEIAQAEKDELFLPLGSDTRLMKTINALLDNPSSQKSLNDYAKHSGASSRTLLRLFKKETGLSFSDWRKRMKLQKAIEILVQGKSVNEVSCELGYHNSSSFIEMFRKELGLPPVKYLAKNCEAKF
ncbi:helix-turn-helix transcriptional regulator [Lentisphaerota bacterium WC36G]|nr:helix-turn-helix transcriptional regulator [Lentisphaerae bacterium WC36]